MTWTSDPPTWPPGPSEMAQRIRDFDWASTPLGPVTSWPQSLRTTVDLCLSSVVPSYVWWGADLTQLYNDAALQINRSKHPAFLGQPAQVAWADVWEQVGELFAHVMRTGESVRGDDLPMVPDRGGSLETAWFTFSYGACRDESGAIAGVFCTAIENTARIRAEQSLRENETRYRNLFAAMDEGYVRYRLLTDAGGAPSDLQIIEVNAAYERLLQRSNPAGRLLRELEPGVDLAWLGILANVASSGQPHRYERYNPNVDRWFDIYVTPAGEHAEEIAVIFSDITERHRSEEAIRNSEARYRALAVASSDVIYHMSPDWRELRPLEGRGFLADAPEPSTSWLQDYIAAEDQGAVTAAIDEAVRTGTPFDLEHRVRRVDGSTGWTRSRAVPITDAAGAVIEWVGSASDITAQKEYEEQLRRSEARYRSLFDSIDEGFSTIEVLFDDEGQPCDLRILEVNPAYEAMTGLTADLVGKRFREFMPAIEDRAIAQYGRVALTGEPLRTEEYASTLGRWFDVFASRIGDSGSNLIACVLQDITARKRAVQDQTFLSSLTQELVGLSTLPELMNHIGERVGRYFDVCQCVFCELSHGNEIVVSVHDWHAPHAPSLAGTYRLHDFLSPEQMARNNAGEITVVSDVQTDPRVSAETYGAIGIRSFIIVPLSRDSQWQFLLTIIDDRPRAWGDGEVALLEELVERFWIRVERARAEALLRAREEQQAFLLQLSDTLRPLSDPMQIEAEAARALGEYLGVDHAYYLTIDAETGIAHVLRDFAVESQPSIVGTYRLSDFPWTIENLMTAGAFAVHDVATDPRYSDAERQRMMHYGFSAFVAHPVIKDGVMLGALGVTTIAPRQWTPEEIALAGEVAERIWAAAERARTETALRQSEAKYRTLFETIDEGFAYLELIHDGQGKLVDVLFRDVNVAFERHSGLQDAIGRRASELLPNLDQPWFDLIRRVSNTGEPFGTEGYVADLERWFNVRVSCIGEPGSPYISVVFNDITERKQRERQQAFLLDLSDRLRSQPDPIAVLATASEALGHYLGVGRCGYGEVDATGTYFDVVHAWTNGTMPGDMGQLRLADFGPEIISAYQSGRTIVINDALADVRAQDAREALAGIGGVRATIGVPLIRGRQWGAAFFVQITEPHEWAADEISLVEEVAERTWTALERARSETALRESEERQAFLLRLSDALRSLRDPGDIQAVASRLLGEHLGANRVHYGERIDDYVHIAHGYGHGVLPMNGRVFVKDFGERVIAQVQAGETVIGTDTQRDATLSLAERKNLDAARIRAFIAAPLVKDDVWVATLGVHSATPRIWRAGEVALVEEVAERTWEAVERARVEAALGASEERYRLLFTSMDQGYCTIEVLFNEGGQPVDYVFLEANPAFFAVTGLGDAVGHRMRDLAPAHEEHWFEIYGRIAQTRVPERFEAEAAALGRWYNVYAFPVGEPAQHQVGILFEDVSERKRQEQRQIFLLNLADALRLHTDAVAIENTALRLLGEHLGVDRVYYPRRSADGDWVVEREYLRGASPSVIGIHPGSAYTWVLPSFLKSAPVVIADTHVSDVVPQTDVSAMDAIQVRAFISAPLIKQGNLVGSISVTEPTPRTWKQDEVELVRETLERTWAAVERARTEAALQEREEAQRFLLRLSDTLRSIPTEVEILQTASMLLGTFLETDRAFFGELPIADNVAIMHPDSAQGDLPSLAGRYAIADFKETLDALQDGQVFVVADVATSEQISERTRAAFLTQGYGAYASVPILRSGRMALNLSVVSRCPRAWTSDEIDLIQEVAERTWMTVERVRAESALLASEERYRLIVQEATDYAILTTDADRRIETWSPGAEMVFGWTAAEVVGQRMDITYIPEDQASGYVEREFAAAREEGSAANVRWHQHKDGTRVFIEGASYARRGEDGTFQGVFQVGQDVTARLLAEDAWREDEARNRKALEAEVAAATAELRTLSRQLLMVQEEERRKLALELHDEIGQVLTGLTFQLAAVQENNPAALADVNTTVQALTEQVRQLALDLRPQVLDRYGLLAAVRWYVERYQQRTGITVHFREQDVTQHRHSPEVEIAAFRIVQEALTNIARYAGVSEAWVTIFSDGGLLVVIRDQGTGFNPGEQRESSGLGGMRERVELLGGAFDLETAPGAGVRITAEFPEDVLPTNVAEELAS